MSGFNKYVRRLKQQVSPAWTTFLDGIIVKPYIMMTARYHWDNSPMVRLAAENYFQEISSVITSDNVPTDKIRELPFYAFIKNILQQMKDSKVRIDPKKDKEGFYETFMAAEELLDLDNGLELLSAMAASSREFESVMRGLLVASCIRCQKKSIIIIPNDK